MLQSQTEAQFFVLICARLFVTTNLYLKTKREAPLANKIVLLPIGENLKCCYFIKIFTKSMHTISAYTALPIGTLFENIPFLLP